MSHRMLPHALRWCLSAAALLAATAAGCTQRGADDVERGAAPSRRPLRPEPAVAAAPAMPAAPSTRPVDSAGRPVIARLVGRDKVVMISHGPAGPLYSATNRAGDVLVAGATLDELRERAPDVYQFLYPAVTRHGARADADAPEAWAGR